MYDFPADFDPATLIGREVEMVSFSGSAVIVTLDQDTRISIFGSYTHGRDAADPQHVQVPPKESTALIRLLGTKVRDASVEQDSTLALQFSNAETLRCLADSKHYECFTIETATKFVVI